MARQAVVKTDYNEAQTQWL